ncbi:DNA-3-methyladenine glycosylase [Ochrobactrum sp. RH2CCR150]|uniref:DNA-3-methyladenine glycosylase n=1 Tax=Ochrobactrum sp. RH2CCR150 TaxID=2587044 RepID=UPI0015F7CD53|nr:DNA-3-methyladenine glycosylase [Ochrobactrum sp. RH2CCR150]
MTSINNLSEFFDRAAFDVAPELIGWTFCVEDTGGVIVETEAYLRTDPASHSFLGRNRRNASMFGEPAVAYVYRIYGLHWCMNVVCADASAVLLRAIEPRQGIHRMQERRRTTDMTRLCSGPAKLAQALGICGNLDGVSLDAPPFVLLPCEEKCLVKSGPRVGVSRATELHWRFWLSGSKFTSRPKQRAKLVAENSS